MQRRPMPHPESRPARQAPFLLECMCCWEGSCAALRRLTTCTLTCSCGSLACPVHCRGVLGGPEICCPWASGVVSLRGSVPPSGMCQPHRCRQSPVSTQHCSPESTRSLSTPLLSLDTCPPPPKAMQTMASCAASATFGTRPLPRLVPARAPPARPPVPALGPALPPVPTLGPAPPPAPTTAAAGA